MVSVWARVEKPGLEWPVIEGWLKKALPYADEPPAILGDGEYLIVARRFFGTVGWAIGAATVGMIDADSAEMILAGGSKDAALPIFEQAKHWARVNGATVLFAEGRKGWARVLPFPVERMENGRAYYRMELAV